MSYADVAAMVEDWELRMRMMAAAAQEHPDHTGKFMDANVWRICGTAGWDAAWSKALAAHAGEADYLPGADEDVITDKMIRDGMRGHVSAMVQTARANTQSSADDTAAAVQAEQDLQFAMYVRQREWDLAHTPQPPEKVIVLEPPVADGESLPVPPTKESPE